MRAAVALAIEATWESYENTDTVINRYRAATIALGYYGDSVLNSMSDILACMVGFLLASRLRWWWTVAWVVAAEVVVAMVIRDNLTLNIIMLIWPIEAIKRWQRRRLKSIPNFQRPTTNHSNSQLPITFNLGLGVGSVVGNWELGLGS
jgi:hypothetical protein